MKWRFTMLFLLAGILTLDVASAADRLILLQVSQAPSAWSDSRIGEKLTTVLTREASTRVERLMPPVGGAGTALVPAADSLIELGRGKGGQFLIYLEITSERIERRKSFQVPLVFHKWEVFGVVSGELRVIDLLRGKQLKAESFEVELRGPRAIQATMDDTPNDPDLHIAAPQKIQFVGRLEDKLVTELITAIKPVLTKGDHELALRAETKKRP